MWTSSGRLCGMVAIGNKKNAEGSEAESTADDTLQ